MREVFGLVDYGQYKVYRRGTEYFCSSKDDVKLRRVKLQNRATAEALAKTPLRVLGQTIEQRLFTANIAGGPDYYEVKHGRV